MGSVICIARVLEFGKGSWIPAFAGMTGLLQARKQTDVGAVGPD